MKVLVEYSNKNIKNNKADGIIVALKDYSVESIVYYDLDEIREIANNKKELLFVKVNKNFMNEEIDALKKVLIELDSLNVDGVFFYDLAVLELKRECNLKINLIWNQTHMVNNYKTCNYYYSKGVKYALLGKEITLEEILEIQNKSNISCMVEVISKPTVAFSKRKLLTNYYQDREEEKKNKLTVREKVTDNNYFLIENNDGTTFFLDIVTNGTGVIHNLYEGGIPYIILREFGLEDCFDELVSDTMKYIQGGCSDSSYITKYKKLGDSTNFFFRKTIYKVKKNG